MYKNVQQTVTLTQQLKNVMPNVLPHLICSRIVLLKSVLVYVLNSQIYSLLTPVIKPVKLVVRQAHLLIIRLEDVLVIVLKTGLLLLIHPLINVSGHVQPPPPSLEAMLLGLVLQSVQPTHMLTHTPEFVWIVVPDTPTLILLQIPVLHNVL